MYNLNLFNDEKIDSAYDFVKIKVNEKEFEVSIVITNKRFVVLRDINKTYYKESFLLATASSNVVKYEVIFETKLIDINDISYKDNNTYIKFDKDKKMIIYNLAILK